MEADTTTARTEFSDRAYNRSMNDPQQATEQDTAASTGLAPTEAADQKQLGLQIEAVLMTTERPLASSKLSELLGKAGVSAVNTAIDQLNQLYADSNRSFRIESVAGGWQIITRPEFADVLAALHKTRLQAHLSPAALETLAIVAYKQPILRAQIEAIRGVASGEVIRGLMERHLVKIVGRAEELGRPMLYGTTRTFLERFGLADLKDLPKLEDLRPKA